MLFEKNFEQKVDDIGKAFTKAINDYDAVAEDAAFVINDIHGEIKTLEIKAASIEQARLKAVNVSAKLKDIFGE